MPNNMRFTTAGKPASLPEVCKLAWHTFYGMQKASEDFENLRFEVWTVAISLDSLHSVGTTSLLIDRQPDKARWALTFSKILTSLSAALRPLYNLVKLYLSSSAKERATVRNWLTHPKTLFDSLTVQDFRRKLSMLVESLNVFLSCLTHAELARAKGVSDSEEFRVLSEVTKNVVHKWDSVQVPYPPPSSVQQRHTNEPPSQHPSGVLNLEDIEQGFRSHVHAMRRIRDQLHQQDMEKDHLTEQELTRAPEISANTKTHHFEGCSPFTSITPTLTHNVNDPTQLSYVSGVYSELSSNGSNSIPSSESSSAISDHATMENKDIKPTTSPPQQSVSSHPRKRRRPTQFRFKTGLEAENCHSIEGEVWNDLADGLSRAKTVLEEVLTTVLFFDQ